MYSICIYRYTCCTVHPPINKNAPNILPTWISANVSGHGYLWPGAENPQMTVCTVMVDGVFRIYFIFVRLFCYFLISQRSLHHDCVCICAYNNNLMYSDMLNETCPRWADVGYSPEHSHTVIIHIVFDFFYLSPHFYSILFWVSSGISLQSSLVGRRCAYTFYVWCSDFFSAAIFILDVVFVCFFFGRSHRVLSIGCFSVCCCLPSSHAFRPNFTPMSHSTTNQRTRAVVLSFFLSSLLLCACDKIAELLILRHIHNSRISTNHKK